MLDKPEDPDAEVAACYSKTLTMVSDDGDFERLCQKLFVFSPFEALGVADYEIRHGNFLAHLFNPNAPHGFGDAVLVAFLKQLLGGNVASEKLAHIVISGIGPVLVRREWHGIDILIELNDPKLKLVIVIELKLHGRESEEQLAKYTDFIEGRREYADYDRQYVFMTPDGTVPSHNSWRAFNMMEGFIDALKQLTQNDNGYETARAMLADYVRIMEQKFMTEKELGDLAKMLWAKYPDVLNFLADNRPDLISNVFDNLYDPNSNGLYEKLNKLGFDFTQDWDHETNSRLIYTFSNWDNFLGMLSGTDKRVVKSKRLMWLEIEKRAEGILAMFVIGPGDTDARRNLLQALIDGKADTGRQRTTEGMSERHSRLSSMLLLNNRNGAHRLEDLERLSKEAVEKLEKFLTQNLPKFDKALSQPHGR